MEDKIWCRKCCHHKNPDEMDTINPAICKICKKIIEGEQRVIEKNKREMEQRLEKFKKKQEYRDVLDIVDEVIEEMNNEI